MQLKTCMAAVLLLWCSIFKQHTICGCAGICWGRHEWPFPGRARSSHSSGSGREAQGADGCARNFGTPWNPWRDAGLTEYLSLGWCWSVLNLNLMHHWELIGGMQSWHCPPHVAQQVWIDFQKWTEHRGDFVDSRRLGPSCVCCDCSDTEHRRHLLYHAQSASTLHASICEWCWLFWPGNHQSAGSMEEAKVSWERTVRAASGFTLLRLVTVLCPEREWNLCWIPWCLVTTRFICVTDRYHSVPWLWIMWG